MNRLTNVEGEHPFGAAPLPAAGRSRDFHKDNGAVKDGENVAINLPFCYLVIR